MDQEGHVEAEARGVEASVALERERRCLDDSLERGVAAFEARLELLDAEELGWRESLVGDEVEKCKHDHVWVDTQRAREITTRTPTPCAPTRWSYSTSCARVDNARALSIGTGVRIRLSEFTGGRMCSVYTRLVNLV